MFYSIYFVLLAAALSAAVVGLGKLWEFLQHYEACQIYHTVGQPPALAFLAHFEKVNVLGCLFVDVHNGLEFVLGGAFSGACD